MEDVPNSRDICRTTLEHAGHAVVETVDGAGGLAPARSEVPDVVVTDVTLPLMDGPEATRRLKADPETAGIAVLVLAARAYASGRGCDPGRGGCVPRRAVPAAARGRSSRAPGGRATGASFARVPGAGHQAARTMDMLNTGTG